MKRSAIDAAILSALALADSCHFALPPLARWQRKTWERRDDLAETLARGIGWDVTDFGHGDFARLGLTLLTIRNGTAGEWAARAGQVYAEKLMFSSAGQETPFHFHVAKTEDIINRGGGRLAVELHPSENVNGGLGLGGGRVCTLVSGVFTAIEAGHTLYLAPGEWIQIPTGVYHRFWAVDGPVMGGEVSSVNDDAGDNVFLVPGARFPVIEEDAPALFLTVGEYPAALGRGFQALKDG
jgi:D-lyxose ketol-isomerase